MFGQQLHERRAGHRDLLRGDRRVELQRYALDRVEHAGLHRVLHRVARLRLAGLERCVGELGVLRVVEHEGLLHPLPVVQVAEAVLLERGLVDVVVVSALCGLEREGHLPELDELSGRDHSEVGLDVRLAVLLERQRVVVVLVVEAHALVGHVIPLHAVAIDGPAAGTELLPRLWLFFIAVGVGVRVVLVLFFVVVELLVVVFVHPRGGLRLLFVLFEGRCGVRAA